jgi:EamA domain-containing membrane protein RarD
MKGGTLRLLNGLRIVMLAHVAILLMQAAFAGMLLAGKPQGAVLHELTAKILVLLAALQVVLAVTLGIKRNCPRWVPVASGALLAAEVIEFSAGYFHNVVLHVPLGMAIFGGALRQLFWAARELKIAPGADATVAIPKLAD